MENTQELIAKLPHKTIERLSQYRRALLICAEKGKEFIFSHEVAEIQHITAVQVRRDLMLVGYSGTLRKGYNIKELIALIGEIIDCPIGINVAIIGMGNFGRAIIKYLANKRENLTIVAGFDLSPDKIGKKIYGIPCYSPKEMKTIVQKKKIGIAVVTVPPVKTNETAKRLIDAGIKGVLNFTSTPMILPDNIFLEEYDMITSLEKVAFYVKQAMIEGDEYGNCSEQDWGVKIKSKQ